jgi:general stress protein YciG
MAQNNQNDTNTSARGFASMDPEKQREIASMGGKAAHEKGTAHEFDSQEAAEAGRKGGKASHGNQGGGDDDGGGNQGSNQGSGDQGGNSRSGQSDSE